MRVVLNEATDCLELSAETPEDLEELTKVRNRVNEHVFRDRSAFLLTYGNDDKGLTHWLWIPLRRR